MRVFPITVDGNALMYVTDSPYEEIVLLFEQSSNLEEMKESLKEAGYSLEPYRPSISLNFDE